MAFLPTKYCMKNPFTSINRLFFFVQIGFVEFARKCFEVFDETPRCMRPIFLGYSSLEILGQYEFRSVNLSRR